MDEGLIDEIAKSVETINGRDHIDKKWRNQYPELFEYVDLMNGVVESMGSHPSGFVVSPIQLSTNVSTLYTKESKYPVTAVNMKELDGNNYVKLDVLGLDNIELINDACKLAGIERLTPDNIDTKDMDVWKSLADSTLGIFQFESDSAYAYLKELFSEETLKNIKENVGDVDLIEILSLANGAIRPSGQSYRDQLAQGLPKDNGHKALNESLSDTMGYLIYQEQIMKFLTDFCNHTGSESDTVRRAIAKKGGVEKHLPEIREKFIAFMSEKYNETEEHSNEILEALIRVIEDAQDYGFSVNHSSPYSFTGYAGAWLRYHYPLEFLTVYFNLQEGDKEKTGKIIQYAKSKGYQVKPIEFGKSRAKYNFDKEEGAIYKGIASIAYLNNKVAEELYELAQKKEYDTNDWVGLLIDIFETSADTRQMEILIRLDFFKAFGTKEVLLEVYNVMADKTKANTVLYPEFADREVTIEKVKKKTKEITYEVKTIKRPLKYDANHKEKTKEERLKNLRDYEVAVKANPPRKIELHEQIEFEKEKLGYAVTTWHDLDASLALVTGIENIRFTPKVHLYQLKTGEEFVAKVAKKNFWYGDDAMLYIGDVIRVIDMEEKNGWKKVDNKWVENPNKKEWHLNKISIVRKSKNRNN